MASGYQISYDSTDWAAIPAGTPAPDYVFPYCDGLYADIAQAQARFPSSICASITAIPVSPLSLYAAIADCEQGDYTNTQVAVWARVRIMSGFVPCIYTSEANWNAVIAALNAIGIASSQVDWWIAAYPGIGPVLYPNSVAHQFEDNGSYDESVVLDGWQPGRPIAAPPSPTPPPTEESEVPVSPIVEFRNAQGQIDGFQITLGTIWHKWIVPNFAPQNEALSGPESVVLNHATDGVTFPDQTPQVSVIGGVCRVTAQDTNERMWRIEQGQSGGWLAQELP